VRKILSGLFLFSIVMFMVGSIDIHANPGKPDWDEFRIPAITLPIDLLPCCNLPPCDDEDNDCDGDNDNQN